nr:serine/threonine-protein kinase [Nocardioides daedukensis]
MPGFEFVKMLGSGGFSDVYQYEQLGLGRKVAVKVLLTDIHDDVQASFAVEANVMAQLSNHPAIVSVYQAGTTLDGRPFLVMEHCPPPHLAARMRQKPLSVGKALDVTIQLCGAVETAHRLGILHRDIKPANILFTEFGRPALTDFGISVTTGRAGAGEGIGVSVPWAPPEQLSAGVPMGPSSDVYAIAATLWASLVGHSPFHVAGGANDSVSMSARVRSMPLAPSRRHDVPESLERALRTAMAKSPHERYDTALSFARALQGIQAELHQSVTTIDVLDQQVEALEEDAPSGTRVSGFVSIDPEAPAAARPGWGTPLPAAPAMPPPEPGWDASESSLPLPENDATRLRARPTQEPTGAGTGPGTPRYDVPPAASAPGGFGSRGVQGAHGSPGAHDASGVPGAPAPRSRVLAILVGLVVIAIVAGVAIWFGTRSPDATDQPTAPERKADPVDPIGPAGPLEPTDVVVQREASSLTVSWTNPDPQDGDTYLLHLQQDPAALDLSPKGAVESKTTKIVLPSDGEACVTVRTVRASQQSEPVLKCDLGAG